MVVLLTDLQLKKYKHTGAPEYKSCGKVPGLIVRCFSSGAKTFYYRKRRDGKLVVIKIGEYPEMSLAEASQYASALSLLVPQGYSSKHLRTAICYSAIPSDIARYLTNDAIADNASSLEPEIRFAVTFGDVHMDWYEKDGKHRKHKAQARQHLRIPKNHFASIYNRPMVDLTIHDYVDALKDCWLNQQPTAKKASHILKAVCLSYAASNRDYLPAVSNAASFTELLRNRHGKPQSKAQKQPHIPHHKAPEFYSEFVEKRDSEAMSNIAAQVVMFTGKRVGEVVALRWDQLHEGVWYQQEYDGKTPDIYDIALTPRVLALIEDARKAGKGLRASNHYVFPSDNRSEGHITPDSVRVQTHKTSFGNKQSPHGWRHVMRGWGRHTGADPQVLEFALGHKEAGIAGHYGSHEVHDRTRKVLTQWEDYLTGEAHG